MANANNSSLLVGEKIRIFFDRFLYENNFSNGDVRNYLDVNKSEFARLVNGKPLDYTKFEMALGKLGLNYYSFMTSEPDARTAGKYVLGDQACVPARYLKSAYSRRRIGRIIFNILAENFSIETIQHLQKSLQIGPDFFNPINDNLTVNTEIYGDIYCAVKNMLGMSERQLFWLGQKTAFYNQDLNWARAVSSGNLLDDYARFIEEIARNIEQSYNYELLKLNGQKVWIKKTLKKELSNEMEKMTYGNKETCFYSIGFATTVTYFSQGHFPKAQIIKNLYDGHDSSVYEIEFTKTKPPSLFVPKHFAS